TLNGAKVTGEQPVSDGDTIRWGNNPDAPLSRVEITDRPGGRELPFHTWRDGTTAPVASRPGVANQWRRAGSSCGQRRAASGGTARPTRSPGWTGARSAATRTSRCTGRRGALASATSTTAGNCSAAT